MSTLDAFLEGHAKRIRESFDIAVYALIGVVAWVYFNGLPVTHTQMEDAFALRDVRITSLEKEADAQDTAMKQISSDLEQFGKTQARIDERTILIQKGIDRLEGRN